MESALRELAPGQAVIGVQRKSGGDPGSLGGSLLPPVDPTGKGKGCCMCHSTDVQGDEGVQLMDGKVIHWKCFKCSKCGVGKQPDMTLFRSKVDRLMQGTYLCDDCTNEHSKVEGGKRASVELKKALYQLSFGAYFGQGAEVKFMIRLLKDGKCRMESASAGEADAALAWQVEGAYTENLNDDGKGVKSITFVVESCGSGASPHTVGGTFDIAVEKGESNPRLVCDGIKCPLHIGTPDHELNALMKTKQPAPKPVPAPAAEHVYADVVTVFTLQQMQNDFKALNVEPAKREMHLSDEEFKTLFGATKEAVQGWAKWQRDKKKKEHKLY